MIGVIQPAVDERRMVDLIHLAIKELAVRSYSVSEVPRYRIEAGLIILQNMAKQTPYADLAREILPLGFKIAWFIPENGTTWRLYLRYPSGLIVFIPTGTTPERIAYMKELVSCQLKEDLWQANAKS